MHGRRQTHIDQVDLIVGVDAVDVRRRGEAELLGKPLQLGRRAAEDDHRLDVGSRAVDAGVSDPEAVSQQSDLHPSYPRPQSKSVLGSAIVPLSIWPQLRDSEPARELSLGDAAGGDALDHHDVSSTAGGAHSIAFRARNSTRARCETRLFPSGSEWLRAKRTQSTAALPTRSGQNSTLPKRLFSL